MIRAQLLSVALFAAPALYLAHTLLTHAQTLMMGVTP